MTTTNPESFTLDGASNITARTGPAATYTIDGENRPTSDGTNMLTWSNADRLTARGADTFSYDPLDRLTASTVAGTTRSYAYSGDGLLQSRTQGATTVLLWDPSVSIARLLQQGSDRIVYGLGPLYVIKGDGTTRALARDGQKSVRAEVDGSGAVTGSWRYRAYGAIAQSSGQTTPSILGYAGQLLDPSALYYMRARWYDAGSARFASRDPLRGDNAEPRTLNSYYYAAANPLLLTDPSGACPLGLCDKLLEFLNSVSFSFGPVVGETIEGGVGDPASGGETFSTYAMAKTFQNGRLRDADNALLESGGIFSTELGETVAVPSGHARSLGGYVGAGGGLFFTNATSREQLLGPFETLKIDLGFVAGGSFEFSRSGSVVIGSVSVGPGIGAAVTTMTTTTRARR